MKKLTSSRTLSATGLLVVLVTGLFTATASAGTVNPSGVITETPAGPDFNYTITLTNSSSSTDNIGTFWYAWLPGLNFLPTAPLAFDTPGGWTAQVTSVGPGDGFGIQWVATSPSAELTPGSSLVFGFTSADTPQQIAGISPYYPNPPIPVNTSFVYQNGPFSGDSAQFLVTPQFSAVPEPSSLALGVIGVLVSFAYLRMKSRKGRVMTRS